MKTATRDRPPTFYRLLVPLPITVVFPSVTYHLELQSISAAGRHELVACDRKAGVWPILSPRYHSPEFLEQAVFTVGFPVRHASIAAVILQRLVHEGRAEVVPAPADDLTERRPASNERLGAWVKCTAPVPR